MVNGRPVEHTQEIEDIAWDYIETFNSKHGQVIPSVVGLCKVINRARSTLYKWAEEEDKNFSDIIDKIMESQQIELVNNGLKGDFNSTITKLMLTKHGLSDRQDIEVIDRTPPTPDKRKSRIQELLDKCKS